MSSAGRATSEVVSSVAEAALVSSRAVSVIVYELPASLAGTVMSAFFGHRPRLRGILGVSDPLQAWVLVGASMDSAVHQLQASAASQADALYVAGQSTGVDVLHAADSTGAYGVFRFHVSNGDVEAGLYHPMMSPTVGTPRSGDVEAGAQLQLTPPAPTTWTNLWSVQAWSDGQVRGTVTQPWDGIPNVYTSPSVPCVELAVKWNGGEVDRAFLYVRPPGAMQAHCVPFCPQGGTLQVLVEGGTGPFTYAIVGGFGNASVSSTGLVSGVVEFDGVVVDVFAVRVTDALGATSTVTIFGTDLPWDLFAVTSVVIDEGTTASLGDPTPTYWQHLELVSTTGGSTLSAGGLYSASTTPGTRDHVRWIDSAGGTSDLYLRVIPAERMQWVQGTEKDALAACGTHYSLVGRGGLGALHTWSLVSSGSGGTLLPAPVVATETAYGHTSVAYVRLRDETGATVDLSAATVSALVRAASGDVLVASAAVQRPDVSTLAVVLPHPGALDLWGSHLNLEVTINLGAGVVINAELLFESPLEAAYEAVK